MSSLLGLATLQNQQLQSTIFFGPLELSFREVSLKPKLALHLKMFLIIRVEAYVILFGKKTFE